MHATIAAIPKIIETIEIKIATISKIVAITKNDANVDDSVKMEAF